MGERVGRVSALLLRPTEPWAVYVLAHGAGAGMRHPFMDAIAGALAARGVATLRYQFPYTEPGGRRPDPAGRARHRAGRGGDEPRAAPALPLSRAASRWADG